MQLQRTQVRCHIQPHIDSDLAIAHHYKGRVHQAKGDFYRAIQDFTMAITLDSAPSANADPKQLGDHWNYCGQCYQELG
jgi:tetratricopeptide (TPR) repeat protein